MKRTNRWGWLAILPALAIGLAACGTTEGESADPAEGGTTGEVTTKEVSDLKIGLLIKQLDAPYFAAMKKMGEDLAAEKGFELLVQDAGADPVVQLDQAQTMLTLEVDALIVNAMSADTQRDQLAQIATEVPLVFVDYGIPGVGVGSVTSNNAEIGRLSGLLTAERLGEGSEITIAILTGPPEDDIVGPARQGGFLAGLEEGGVTYTIVAESPASWSQDRAVPAAESMLAANPDVDLILGLNDSMALGALTVLDDQGNKSTLIAAAADGQREALSLINDEGCEGRYISTGLNSPALATLRAFEIAIAIATGEASSDDFEESEFTEAAGINCENIGEFYDPESVF